MKTNVVKTVLFGFVLFVVFAIPANAQIPSFDVGQSPEGALSLSLSPEHPRPGVSVKATLSSLRHDLDRSTVSWLIDGAVEKAGVGVKTFSFTAPPVGATAIVSVSVTTAAGQSFSASRSVTPAEVVLVWEATSSVPPFYGGKALFPPQGHIKIVALPNIPGASQESVVYTWKKNGTILGSLSGIGKNILELDASVTDRSMFVVVEVESPNGIVAQQGLRLSTTQPFAQLYENSSTD